MILVGNYYYRLQNGCHNDDPYRVFPLAPHNDPVSSGHAAVNVNLDALFRPHRLFTQAHTAFVLLSDHTA